MKHSMEPIPVEELHCMMKVEKDSEFKAIPLLMLSGLTWKDICMLKWNMISFNEQIIVVNKGTMDQRRIMVGEELLEVLLERKELLLRRTKEQKEKNKAYKEDAVLAKYVFVKDEKVFTRETIKEYIRNVSHKVKQEWENEKEYNFQEITPQKLRHSFIIYWMLGNKLLDCDIIAKILGIPKEKVIYDYIEGTNAHIIDPEDKMVKEICKIKPVIILDRKRNYYSSVLQP